MLDQYKKKFVAFIDILGFKAIIDSIENRSKTYERDFKNIFSILNYLNEESIESDGHHDLPIYEETENGLLLKELGNPVITYVSDCLVISTDGTFDGFKSLCNKLTKFSSETIADGFFLRGAIVYGDVFHTGRILFGTGYQKAFYLEQTIAKHPRIIIDQSVLDKLKENIGIFPLNETAITKDVDDLYFLRLFQLSYFPYYTYSWLDYLLRCKSHILYLLNLYDERVSGFSMELKNLDSFCCWKEKYTWDLDFTGGSNNILSKYIWIAKQFNETIKKYEEQLLSRKGKITISQIVFKNGYWQPEELLGHIRD